MALYALDNLDDAIDVTRNFLTPVRRHVWLRLAVIALFVSGAGTNVASWSFGGDGEPMPADQLPAVDVEPWVWPLIAAVVVGLVLLGLGFLLVGSIMEFVFVESLRNEQVTIRRYWRQRWRQGLRLFGFRLVLGLLVLGAVLLVAAPVLLPLVGVGTFSAGAALLVLFVPLFLVLAIVVAVVHSFTTVFVVPIMIQSDTGVLTGWRRLWPAITAQWRQFLAYALVGFVLSILGGVAVGVVTVLLVLAALLPFGLLFALSYGLFVVFPPLGILAFVVVGIVFVLVVITVAAIAQVPVKTYLRYYALLVLGDVDPAFDLIATQRAAVRDDESPAEE